MKRSASIKIVLCGIFAAFTCICAMISIPFGVVPINMAHIAIFISAWILGPSLALVSQFVYIFLGILGLPVFSGFTAGVGHILGPTGGFIIAYPLVAWISAILFKSNKFKGLVGIIIGVCIGWLLEYFIGTVYYCFVTSTSLFAALTVCVVPFVFGDICKTVIVVIMFKKFKVIKLK